MTIPAYLAQASDAEIDRLLWSAYFSHRCPGCASRKASEQPICVACYARLSDEQREALTIPIDPGYELALFHALESAGVAVPIDGVRRSAWHFQNATAKEKS